MVALLLASVILVIVSSSVFAILFLELPFSLLHSFDWLFSWTHIFDRVGYWLTLAILALILSWFLSE